MPIDGNKMQAFMGGPAPDQADQEGGDDGEHQEGGSGKFSELIPVLEDHAGEIEDAAMALEANPEEVLNGQEPDEETLDRLHEGYDELDEELRNALAPLVDGNPDDCRELARHLHDEGMIDDEDEVAAWLCLVGKEILGAGADEGEEEDEEGGDEDEGGEDEEPGEDADDYNED